MNFYEPQGFILRMEGNFMLCSKRSLIGVVVLAILVFGAFSTASAQSLHDKWFKVLVKADTSRLTPSTGFFSSYKFQFYIYVHLEYVGPGGPPRGSVYNWEIWCKRLGGRWGLALRSILVASNPYSEHIFSNRWIGLTTETGEYLETLIAPRIVAAPLSNAFIAGGEIFAGLDRDGRRLFGWLTMKGQMTPRPKWAHND